MKIPIVDIQPEQWYNLQDTLPLYEQAIVDGFGGPVGLKMAGTRIMPIIKKQSNFLDAFASPRELLEALDTLCQANRGPAAGHLKAVETTDNSVVLEDTSPHLPELQFGMAEVDEVTTFNRDRIRLVCLLDRLDPANSNGTYPAAAQEKVQLLEGHLCHPLCRLAKAKSVRHREPDAPQPALRRAAGGSFLSRYLFLHKAFGRSVIIEALESRRGFYFDTDPSLSQRMKLKVLPCPSSLSTQMRPPCISANTWPVMSPVYLSTPNAVGLATQTAQVLSYHK